MKCMCMMHACTCSPRGCQWMGTHATSHIRTPPSGCESPPPSGCVGHFLHVNLPGVHVHGRQPRVVFVVLKQRPMVLFRTQSELARRSLRRQNEYEMITLILPSSSAPPHPHYRSPSSSPPLTNSSQGTHHHASDCDFALAQLGVDAHPWGDH